MYFKDRVIKKVVEDETSIIWNNANCIKNIAKISLKNPKVIDCYPKELVVK